MCVSVWFVLTRRRQPRSTRAYTLFPDTTLFRSQRGPPRPRPSSAPLTVMTRSEAPQLQVGPVHDRLPQRADLRIHAMARHRCLRLDEALDGLGGFGDHGDRKSTRLTSSH